MDANVIERATLAAQEIFRLGREQEQQGGLKGIKARASVTLLGCLCFYLIVEEARGSKPEDIAEALVFAMAQLFDRIVAYSELEPTDVFDAITEEILNVALQHLEEEPHGPSH